MTPEQIAALMTVPGMIAFAFIVVRQQAQIDKLVQALMDSNERFMALHPPQDDPPAKPL